jgi:hypothetical protein
MTDISYEEVVKLVEQLPEEQKQDLAQRLQHFVPHRKLTVCEKMTLLRAAQLNVAVNEEPSIRREDWYDDEGR